MDIKTIYTIIDLAKNGVDFNDAIDGIGQVFNSE